MHPTDPSPSASPQQNAGFFRYVAALLLISAAAFISFSTLGCGSTSSSCGGSGNDSNSTMSTQLGKSMATPGPVTASMQTLNPKSAYQPGEKMELLLKGNWQSAGNGELRWLPPQGTQKVEFPGLQPAPGGPPYIFKNVIEADGIAGIPVSYTVPPPPLQEINGQMATTLVDNLAVYGPNPIEAQFANISHNYGQSGQAAAQLSGPASFAVLPAQAPSSDPVAVWNVLRYTDIYAHIDQAACQDMVTQGQSANAFMAWRVPLADQIVPNQSYPLPLISSGTVYPQIVLSIPGVGVKMPMEVRLAATQWANANLPSAPGEVWVALGLDPNATITCQWMERDAYYMISVLSFDLSGRPQACENCVLLAYACYKTGSAAGTGLLGAALDLLGSTAPRAVLADNTTCLGPTETPLVDPTSNWLFKAYTEFLNLKPGDPIEIHYWIQNKSTSPQTFTFSTASNLPGVDWTIFSGQSSNLWEPDLSNPLVATSVNVPGSTNGVSGSFHFHIRGVTPVGASAGQYNYAMTINGIGAVPATWKGGTILNVSSTGQLPELNAPLAAVQLSGAASPSLAYPNQDLTYTLTVNNSGALKLTDLVVTDILPDNTTFVSCSGGDRGNNCLNTAGTVTWNLTSLDAGLSHAMILVVRVNAGLPAGTLHSNTVYSVITGQSVSANGNPITTVEPYLAFLPAIRK